MKKKKLLIGIAVFLLIVVGVLLVSTICNRRTKPTFKNRVDDKEWYDKVNPESIEQVRDYCQRRGFSTKYYILVDFSIRSGKKRFFIYDLKSGRRVMSSYCMHGSGPGNTNAKPKFSNKPGSGCSSLGRYVMIGKGGKRNKSCIRLRGLDRSNRRAAYRGILIHSAGKVTRFHGEKKYIPIGRESEGCFTVSTDCVRKVMKIYRNSSKTRPVLIFAKYK
jgi:hypothetical protein